MFYSAFLNSGENQNPKLRPGCLVIKKKKWISYDDSSGSLILCLPGCCCFYYFFLLISAPPRPSNPMDGVDFHKGIHEEMSHPLGSTAAAVQSLTVFFFPIINILWFALFFFQRSAMATVHVKMSHSLPTSQTLSWGGALAPVWRRAGDPTPSPHPAGGSLAASSPDRPGRHPEGQQERVIVPELEHFIQCGKKNQHIGVASSPRETCKCVWCDSCPPLWQEAPSP